MILHFYKNTERIIKKRLCNLILNQYQTFTLYLIVISNFSSFNKEIKVFFLLKVELNNINKTNLNLIMKAHKIKKDFNCEKLQTILE